MYEVAQVAGNKVEAACALQSLSSIMGISSSHHGGSHSSNQYSSNHNSHRKSSYERDQLKKQITNRDLQKIRESYKRAKDAPLTSSSSSGSGSSNGTNVPSSGAVAGGGGGGTSTVRPITISEMNAYNAEKSNESANTSITLSNKNNNSLSGTNDSLIRTHTSNKKKEFYKVGEGYHKTDSCYYKTPDGGYHKLPPDSYHKMSEICYNKMPDGSFKRLDDLLQNGNPKANESGTANNQHSNQSKVRNQMIRFLKRSKSHTPATIKEMQKAKEREQRPINNNMAHRDGIAVGPALHIGATNQSAANSTNRKVVVTMMENGGLPIVATSKSSSKRDHSTRDNKDHRSKDKVNE